MQLLRDGVARTLAPLTADGPGRLQDGVVPTEEFFLPVTTPVPVTDRPSLTVECLDTPVVDGTRVLRTGPVSYQRCT